ncbi:hypothetical protein KSP40_PGU007790 [Platanthera guangdongensis]|uniref:Uncharacterized protein n=1 Tax=Platanthera guangdongensis TaxID=2320717 RepID=A0ABR2LKR0_9ASPA
MPHASSMSSFVKGLGSPPPPRIPSPRFTPRFGHNGNAPTRDPIAEAVESDSAWDGALGMASEANIGVLKSYSMASNLMTTAQAINLQHQFPQKMLQK